MKARLVVTASTISALVLLIAGALCSATDSEVRATQPAVHTNDPTTATVDTEYKLPFPQGRIFRPRISGDWVVAIYNIDMSNATPTAQILAYNLATKRMYTLWPGGAGWPDVDGNFATWTGKSNTQATFGTLKGGPNRGMPSNLLVCDLNTGAYYCPALRTGGVTYPVMGGNYVTYVASGHIFLVDMMTGDQRQLSDPNKGNRNYTSTIGGDCVTWMNDDGGTSVCIYRISTGESFTVESQPGVKVQGPRTDGKTVAWTGNGKDSGVYFYDIATQQTGRFAQGNFPDVDNGLTVYMKPLKGENPIYGLFPFRGVKEFRISKGSADQGPSISGNRVIWCKDNVIYCAELDFGDKKPIAKPLSPTP